MAEIELEFEEAPIRLFWPDGPVIALTTTGKAHVRIDSDGEYWIEHIELNRWDDDLLPKDNQLLQHSHKVTDEAMYRGLRSWIEHTQDMPGAVSEYQMEQAARIGDARLDDMVSAELEDMG